MTPTGSHKDCSGKLWPRTAILRTYSSAVAAGLGTRLSACTGQQHPVLGAVGGGAATDKAGCTSSLLLHSVFRNKPPLLALSRGPQSSVTPEGHLSSSESKLKWHAHESFFKLVQVKVLFPSSQHSQPLTHTSPCVHNTF